MRRAKHPAHNASPRAVGGFPPSTSPLVATRADRWRHFLATTGLRTLLMVTIMAAILCGTLLASRLIHQSAPPTHDVVQARMALSQELHTGLTRTAGARLDPDDPLKASLTRRMNSVAQKAVQATTIDELTSLRDVIRTLTDELDKAERNHAAASK